MGRALGVRWPLNCLLEKEKEAELQIGSHTLKRHTVRLRAAGLLVWSWVREGTAVEIGCRWGRAVQKL